MKQSTHSPIIGITSMMVPVESGSLMGCKRTAVGHHYIEAIRLTGGVPFVLPIIEDTHLIEKQMQAIDGLLLTGGDDVSPCFYNEQPMPELGPVCLERDQYELQLLQLAKKRQMPIFGICRGMQLLNVSFGGSLYQDIPSHKQDAKPDDATHEVMLTPNTKLRRILEEASLKTLMTNSFHHQAVKQLAPSFVVNALSQDGIIEGIESDDESFILGVQWHPELMIKKHPKMLKLFHAFVDAAVIGKRI